MTCEKYLKRQFYIFTLKRRKNKKLKIWDRKSLIWVFMLKLEKNIVIFETRSLKFAKVQSYIQKERNLNLEPNTLYLSLFRSEFEKDFKQTERTLNLKPKTLVFFRFFFSHLK